MRATDDSPPEKTFNVKVGLAECVVTCQSERDAVQLARTHFGQKMPQMWDVIQGIAEKDFHIDPLG